MRILFVCMGNICRSPTAEAAVAEALAEAGLGDNVFLDSAGTGSWHVGDPPDPRMASAAQQQGLVLTGKGRQFTPADFDRFDLICVMDKANLRKVREQARDESDLEKVRMFRDFDTDADAPELPDPYFGGEEGFRRVVLAARAAARGLAEHVAAQAR